MPSVLNLGTTPVYAASSSGEITDISVETNKDKTVNVYTKSSYSSKYKLSKLDDDDSNTREYNLNITRATNSTSSSSTTASSSASNLATSLKEG